MAKKQMEFDDAKSIDESIESNAENIVDDIENEADSMQDENAAVKNENVASEDNENLESLKAKIKELEDKYLRAHADFENVKKRLERDKNQALEYANEKILKDILPVADTLENALKSAKDFALESDKGEKIAEGIKLTLDKLHKVLNNHGVEIIESSGEPDPNLHHAINQVPHDTKQDGQIADVLQTGYKYKDRTLRPALVSVVKN